MSGINFSYVPSTTLKYKSLTDGYKGLNSFGSSGSYGTSFSLGNSSGTSSASGALSGLGWSALRTVGNNIVGGAVNQTYKNLDSPYAQQVKDLFDATQDPIARAVKNWTGKGRDNILSAIHNDTPNEDLFKFNIAGSDNASLLGNFGYDRHSDEELGIRKNIKRKSLFGNIADVTNQAGVGATYGAEYGGGIGAIIGAGAGLLAGINNAIYDDKNTTKFNDAINQNNLLKRMRESSYQDDYLAQYSNQVNDVANMNYRNNIRDYYGILRDGGSIHIKPENRGKFTALKERTGHSATWFKENGTPAQKKMAIFELNSKKWKHRNGGYLNNLIEGKVYDLTEDSINNLISQGYEIEYI